MMKNVLLVALMAGWMALPMRAEDGDEPQVECCADTLQTDVEALCRQQLGGACAKEAARILTLHRQYLLRCAPERLDAKTFDLLSGEWQERADEYALLERDATILRERMPVAARKTYGKLIYTPVRIMANRYNFYHAMAMRTFCDEQGDPRANEWAERMKRCVRRDRELCDEYNRQTEGDIGSSWHPLDIGNH